jgi:hypothetical protein
MSSAGDSGSAAAAADEGVGVRVGADMAGEPLAGGGGIARMGGGNGRRGAGRTRALLGLAGKGAAERMGMRDRSATACAAARLGVRMEIFHTSRAWRSACGV